MIENKRQYAVTKAEVVKFEEAVAAGPDEDLPQVIQEAQMAALTGVLDELREEVRVYEEKKP